MSSPESMSPPPESVSAAYFPVDKFGHPIEGVAPIMPGPEGRKLLEGASFSSSGAIVDAEGAPIEGAKLSTLEVGAPYIINYDVKTGDSISGEKPAEAVKADRVSSADVVDDDDPDYNGYRSDAVEEARRAARGLENDEAVVDGKQEKPVIRSIGEKLREQIQNAGDLEEKSKAIARYEDYTGLSYVENAPVADPTSSPEQPQQPEQPEQPGPKKPDLASDKPLNSNDGNTGEFPAVPIDKDGVVNMEALRDRLSKSQINEIKNARQHYIEIAAQRALRVVTHGVTSSESLTDASRSWTDTVSKAYKLVLRAEGYEDKQISDIVGGILKAEASQINALVAARRIELAEPKSVVGKFLRKLGGSKVGMALAATTGAVLSFGGGYWATKTLGPEWGMASATVGGAAALGTAAAGVNHKRAGASAEDITIAEKQRNIVQKSINEFDVTNATYDNGEGGEELFLDMLSPINDEVNRQVRGNRVRVFGAAMIGAAAALAGSYVAGEIGAKTPEDNGPEGGGGSFVPPEGSGEQKPGWESGDRWPWNSYERLFGAENATPKLNEAMESARQAGLIVSDAIPGPENQINYVQLADGTRYYDTESIVNTLLTYTTR